MKDFAFFLSEEFKAAFKGRILLNESMKKHTTFKIGGEAPVYFEPEEEGALVNLIKELSKRNCRFFVLGGGSNIVVSEKIDFAVISTIRLNKVEISEETGRMKCASGASWGNVTNFCIRNRISGFEAFRGLPGTAGGAIFINATCFGFSTCDRLRSVRYLDLEDFEIKQYEMNQSDWGYKKSPFQTSRKIVLSAEFEIQNKTEKTDKEIEDDYKKVLMERVQKKHFESPSAGSVFRNIPEQGIIAGKLVDECGLKGTKLGGAKVADWHGNFIINEGNATSEDVRNLVKIIQDKVKSEKNVDLKCEIIFVPENVDIKK